MSKENSPADEILAASLGLVVAFASAIGLALLLYVLFAPADANAGEPVPPPRADLSELDLGGGFRQRTGVINGERFESQTQDLGGGMSQEIGRVGKRRFHCETLDMGYYSTTTCY